MNTDPHNENRNAGTASAPNTPNGGRLALILILFSAVIFVAGLWPFSFFPKNQVFRMEGEKGLIFDGHGIVVSDNGDRGFVQSSFSRREITIELWVKPTAEPSNGVSSIIAFYDPLGGTDFFAGQWRSHLIVRTQTDQQGKEKRNYREIGLREGLTPNKESFLTITSGAKGTTVYLNGKHARAHPGYSVFCDDGFPGQIVVGNSPSGKQGWSGDLLGLAVYNRSLSADEVMESYTGWKESNRGSLDIRNTVGLYPLDQSEGTTLKNRAGATLDLALPLTFLPPQRILLSWSPEYVQHGWASFQDVLLNVAGFIPLGFLTSTLLLRRNRLGGPAVFVLTTLIGTVLSLSLELTQAYLPTRDSSLADLICNAAGTALGAMVCFWLPTQRMTMRWL